MVERARLESGAWETTRGFESLPLRSVCMSDDDDARFTPVAGRLRGCFRSGPIVLVAAQASARSTASRTPSTVRGLDRVAVAPIKPAS